MPYQVYMPVVEGEAPGRNTIPNPTGHANGTAMVVKDGLYVISEGVAGGNVTGPSSSVSGHIAVFDNTSGTLLRDGGTLFQLLATFMTPGSLLYKNNLGAVVTLPAGNPGEMLTMGTDGLPAWAPSQP